MKTGSLTDFFEQTGSITRPPQSLPKPQPKPKDK